MPRIYPQPPTNAPVLAGDGVTDASVNTPNIAQDNYLDNFYKSAPIITSNLVTTTVTTNNVIILLNLSSNDITLNLPLIDSANYYTYVFKVISIGKSGGVNYKATITPNAGNTINGASNFILDTLESSITLQSDLSGTSTDWKTYDFSSNFTQTFLKATRTTALTLTNTLATIGFNNVISDIGNNYNAGTGVFTCPVAGKYSVTAGLWITSGTSAEFEMHIRLNSVIERAEVLTAATRVSLNSGVEVIATAGSTIDVQARTSVNRALDSSDVKCQLYVTYLGR